MVFIVVLGQQLCGKNKNDECVRHLSSSTASLWHDDFKSYYYLNLPEE